MKKLLQPSATTPCIAAAVLVEDVKLGGAP
jgi:hypothetical protein